MFSDSRSERTDSLFHCKCQESTHKNETFFFVKQSVVTLHSLIYYKVIMNISAGVLSHCQTVGEMQQSNRTLSRQQQLN